MVRPKVKEPKQQYTLMLKPSVVEEIDKLAGKLELSRSQLMSNLIESGLEDAKLLEKIGVLKLAMLGDKISQKFKRGLLSGKYSVDEEGDIQVKE
jgi:metal-responsive CopG/Arc/MetJ family transcriptional regulator